MVGRWGMSEKLGPITLLPSDGQGPLLPGAISETSPQTQWLIDEEVRRIVDDAHAEVTKLLSDHREQLDNLTHALLEAETLDAPDAYAAAGIPMRTCRIAGAAPAEVCARARSGAERAEDVRCRRARSTCRASCTVSSRRSTTLATWRWSAWC